jgi:hypothetical protein
MPTFTQGVNKAKVQLESSIPIGTKVEIMPRGFRLGIKAKLEIKQYFQSAPSY